MATQRRAHPTSVGRLCACQRGCARGPRGSGTADGRYMRGLPRGALRPVAQSHVGTRGKKLGASPRSPEAGGRGRSSITSSPWQHGQALHFLQFVNAPPSPQASAEFFSPARRRVPPPPLVSLGTSRAHPVQRGVDMERGPDRKPLPASSGHGRVREQASCEVLLTARCRGRRDTQPPTHRTWWGTTGPGPHSEHYSRKTGQVP